MEEMRCECCLHNEVCESIEFNNVENSVNGYECEEFINRKSFYNLPVIPNEQIIYSITATWQFSRILDYQIKEITLTEQDLFQALSWGWFGKFYFLTKEEAVQKAEEYKQKGIEVNNV